MAILTSITGILVFLFPSMLILPFYGMAMIKVHLTIQETRRRDRLLDLLHMLHSLSKQAIPPIREISPSQSITGAENLKLSSALSFPPNKNSLQSKMAVRR